MNKPACPKHETGGGPCTCQPLEIPAFLTNPQRDLPLNSQPVPVRRTVAGCQRLDGGADCLVVGPCGGCANAIYEEIKTPAPRPCESHHYACNCREHGVAVLIKAALDAAVQLDDMKNAIIVTSRGREADQEAREKNRLIVERVYAACEALGEKIGVSADEVPA